MTTAAEFPPQVQEVRVLRWQPGDVIVVKVPVTTPPETLERVRHGVAQHFPPEAEILVIGDSTDLEVVRKGALHDGEAA